MPTTSPAQTNTEQNQAVISEYTTTIDLTISFSETDFTFDQMMGYDIIELKDGYTINTIGKPVLPTKEINVALPNSIKITKVQVKDTREIEIKGKYYILPGQPPRRTNGLDDATKFINPDKETYDSMNPYPGTLVELVEHTDLAGQAIAVLQVYPLQ